MLQLKVCAREEQAQHRCTGRKVPSHAKANKMAEVKGGWGWEAHTPQACRQAENDGPVPKSTCVHGEVGLGSSPKWKKAEGAGGMAVGMSQCNAVAGKAGETVKCRNNLQEEKCTMAKCTCVCNVKEYNHHGEEEMLLGIGWWVEKCRNVVTA